MTKRSPQPTSTPIPWLSGLLAVVCAIATIHAHLESQRIREDVRGALGSAEAYFNQHPYLEPGPALGAKLSTEIVARQRRAHETRRRQRGSIPAPPRVVARRQEQLDRQVAEALASVDAVPARRWGALPAAGPGAGWLSYPVLHAGNWHLVGNLLLLLFLGMYLERGLGRLTFPGIVVGTTLAGAGAFARANPDLGSSALVGTSPLLVGLLAAFAVQHWRERGEGFYIAGLVLGAVWLGLPPWAQFRWSVAEAQLIQAGIPAASTSVYSAYLGSGVCGALLGLVALAIGSGAHARSPGSAGSAAHPAVERALRAREKGQSREAFDLLEAAVKQDPDAYEACLALWDVANEIGRPAEATSALLRAIRLEVKRGLTAAAVDHWLEVTADGFPAEAESALLIRMALLLREEDHSTASLMALREALERTEGSTSGVVASKVARAARDLDPDTAEAAAWQALGSVELELEERQALENLIAEMQPDASERRLRFAARAQPEPASQPRPQPPPAAHPAAIEIQVNERGLDAVVAVPLELDADGLHISTESGQKKRVRYERIEAVAVAAVHGLGAKPVILVDLVLNWMTTANETLHVVRLRGDRFDPRRLVEGQPSAVESLRAFVAHILEKSGATPLPDAEAALGRPFASFDEIGVYQSAVLMVDGEGKPASRT